MIAAFGSISEGWGSSVAVDTIKLKGSSILSGGGRQRSTPEKSHSLRSVFHLSVVNNGPHFRSSSVPGDCLANSSGFLEIIAEIFKLT